MKKRQALAARKYLAPSIVVITLIHFTVGSGGLSARTAASSEPRQPAAPKTVWDGVYTKEQAIRGQAAYMQVCSYCHRADMSGSEVRGELAPELVGAYFLLRWSGPLSQLLIKIDDEMPKDAPGTVTSEAAIDIIGYLLEANDARPGTAELPPDREKVKQVLVTKKP